MATLVGVLIIAIAAAVVLPDVLASARRRPAASSSPDLVPGAVNDPRVQDLNSRIDALAITLGSIAGRGAGAGAGSAVSGAEVGFAHGIGTHTLSDAERAAITERAYAAGLGAGGAGGTNVGALVGGAAGGMTVAPFAFVEGAGRGIQSALGSLGRFLAEANVPRYDVQENRWEDPYGNPI